MNYRYLIWLVLGLAIVAVIGLVFKLQQPKELGDKNTFIPQINKVLPKNYLVTLEDAQDYPNDPAGLHEPTFHILDQNDNTEQILKAQNFERSQSLIGTSRNLYYFDKNEKKIREAISDKTLDFTQVDNADLSGYFTVFYQQNLPERIAWVDSRFEDGNTISEIWMATAEQEIKPIKIFSQTFKGEQSLIPQTWLSDGETLLFSSFDFTNEISFDHGFENLFQLKIPYQGAPLIKEPQKILFPKKNALLLALNSDLDQYIYKLKDEIIIGHLDNDETKSYQLADADLKIIGVAHAVNSIALSIYDQAKELNQIVLLPSISRTVNLVEFDGEDLLPMYLDEQEIIVSRAGTEAESGTWEVVLYGANDKSAEKLSAWQAVRLIK